MATREGFTYSPALHDLAAREPVWTEALLDRFITDPLAVAPRTRMRFAGLRDSAEREALIIVLRTTGRAP